jgi:hypothetical protein
VNVRPVSIPLASVVLSLLLLALPARAAELRTIEGTWDEEVTSIREEGGRMVVRTAERTVPLEQVKSIRFREEGAPAGRSDRPLVKVVLANGDALRGTITGGDPTAIRLESPGLGAMTVSLELVRALLVDCSPERERELEGGLTRSGLDRVLLKDGGSAIGSLNRIEESRLFLDTTVDGGSKVGKEYSASLSKVELVAFAADSATQKPQGLHVRARLVDGSFLTGRLVQLDPTSGLRLEHPLGPGGALDLPLERVASVVVQGGAVSYLSDLEPRAPVDQHFPSEFTYEPEMWGWKRDRNVTGGALRLGGRAFDKGLGVHSYCALTYDLGGAYKELRAVIGLDDVTRGLGEPGLGGVVFKVLVDGKPAGEPGGWTKLLGDPPTPITIDVTGARTLTLIVDFDRSTLHILGRADWADAHLIRR